MTRLRLATIAFAVAVLLHNGDHLRRGADSVGADVFWAGSLSILLEVAVVVLVVQGHRWAPLAATVAGASLAVGYVVVHVLPARSWLSDPLFSGGASRLSQAAALLEIAAAGALAAAGYAALRERGGLASAALAPPEGPRPLRAVARHPVVAAMVIGNAAIFGFSVAGL